MTAPRCEKFDEDNFFLGHLLKVGIIQLYNFRRTEMKERESNDSCKLHGCRAAIVLVKIIVSVVQSRLSVISSPSFSQSAAMALQ
mmetsp:Transcript_11804/g.22107  ORF Transcript_11804/g.22107 Transcript_11804/m.22107 type:complete len:85 (+) Transcript_11804:585-839(+)